MKAIWQSETMRRMARCKVCHGKGYFYAKFPGKRRFKAACLDCADWVVVLKGVRQLEKQLRDEETKGDRVLPVFDF